MERGIRDDTLEVCVCLYIGSVRDTRYMSGYDGCDIEVLCGIYGPTL
jgi:hypothetical protein